MAASRRQGNRYDQAAAPGFGEGQWPLRYSARAAIRLLRDVRERRNHGVGSDRISFSSMPASRFDTMDAFWSTTSVCTLTCYGANTIDTALDPTSSWPDAFAVMAAAVSMSPASDFP